jgi:hypothetical protein
VITASGALDPGATSRNRDNTPARYTAFLLYIYEGVKGGSIELFIEDRAFLRSYDLVWLLHLPLSLSQVLFLFCILSIFY